LSLKPTSLGGSRRVFGIVGAASDVTGTKEFTTQFTARRAQHGKLPEHYNRDEATG
jgi:hypothetical protein